MTKFAGLLLIFTLLLMAAAGAPVDGKLTMFINDYHTASIVLVVLLVSILLLPIFDAIGKQVVIGLGERIETKRFFSRVRHLSPADKHTISLFVDERKLTCALNPSEPSVAWLESTKIILRSGDVVDGKKAIYRITLFAMDYFTKNPNVLR